MKRVKQMTKRPRYTSFHVKKSSLKLKGHYVGSHIHDFNHDKAKLNMSASLDSSEKIRKLCY